jgi:Heparinase II/III-like protein/Heparinase II/III N-terminus
MRVLAGLDRLFPWITMRSAWLGRRYSHRLARGIQSTAAAAHEAVWRVAMRAGLLAPPAALVRAALTATVKDAPRYPAPVSSGVTPLAAALVGGQYLFESGASVPVERLSWLRRPVVLPATPRAGLRFHSLDGVRQLVEAHGLGAGPEYLDAARRVTRRWIAECLFAERGHSVWSDHTTALRALVLAQLWLACRPEETADSSFARDLLTALIRHATRLAHPAFYRDEHNHGVTQAYALLALGVLLSPHVDAARWVRLGRERLEAQVAKNVSPDGVHREHSPAYQQYVLLQLLCALRFARAHGEALSPAFERRLVAMVEAATHMLKPDGTLAALGDGSAGLPVLVRPEDLLGFPHVPVAAYTHAVTRGAAGRPPAARDAVFLGGGCAFLRSGWGATGRPSGSESFVSVRLETFPTSHVHRDLLSFELQAFGTDLVVDAGGPGLYPLRAWLKATAAHNTVVVDGQDQGIGRADLRASRFEPGWALLDAEHRAYAGVCHRRILVFRRSGELLVIDRLESDRRRRYSLLFHLAADLTPLRDGLGARTRSATGVTLQVLPLVTADLSLEIHRGVVHPPQGWLQMGPDRTAPSSTLEYRREGGGLTFATLLLPGRPGAEPAATATVAGRLLEGDARISVASPEGSWVLGLDAAGSVTQHDLTEDARP